MPNEMRILQVNSATGWSGGQAQVFFLAKGLMERGHKVWIACPENSVLKKRAQDAGILVEPVPMASEADIPSIKDLYKIMKRHGIQVVNAHKPLPFTLSSPAAFFAKVPVMVFSRRVSFELGRNPISRLKWKIFKLDGIIAVSQKIKQELLRFGYPEGMIEVIYSATDTELFKPGVKGARIRKELNIPKGAILVTKVANHFEWKGHMVFIDAAKKICDERENIYFLVVGNQTDFTPYMTRKVGAIGLQNRFFIWGYREDIPEIIAASDVTVNASITGEGLAGVLRESLAMKVPVVSTCVGGNPEVVLNEKTGLLVKPNDSELLKSAILRLLDEREFAKGLAEEGYKMVAEKFSIDAMVEKTERFYERLLSSRQRGRMIGK